MKTITFTKSRIVSLAILAAIFVVLALLPTFYNGYWITELTDILRYAVLTVAWVIFSGPTGYMSLATAAFFGLGFYIAAVFNGPLPFVVVIIIAGVVGFVVALAGRCPDAAPQGCVLHHLHLRTGAAGQQRRARGRAPGDRDARTFRPDREHKCRVLGHVHRLGADGGGRGPDPALTLRPRAAEHRRIRRSGGA